MAGPFLSDKSLHAQVGSKLADTDDGRPVFDYTVTFYGHWGYDASKFRPAVLESKSHVDEVNAYVNTMHYKSREMMDALAHIQASDPDSIIILFGDHLADPRAASSRAMSNPASSPRPSASSRRTWHAARPRRRWW